MTWAVLCDFDHTVTTEDVTDTLLKMHARPEWHGIEKFWEQGLIGSRECMQQQVQLLRATAAQIDEVADSIAIAPYFAEFAAFCEDSNVPLLIVSDGLDVMIDRILKRIGLEHIMVVASHLEPVGENRWQLSAPFADTGCSSQASTCKCKVAARLRSLARAEYIFYIGDGRSDYCISANEADLVLAQTSLLDYCRKQKIEHAPFKDFTQATRMLNQLIQHRPAKPQTIREPLIERQYA